MKSVAVALAVARKDLTSEWRTRELVPALAQFIVLALVIANFGFQFDSRTASAIAPGVLWMTLVFAGLVAFGRAFAAEREQASLEAMLLTPAAPAAIFAGKALAAALLLVLGQAVQLAMGGSGAGTGSATSLLIDLDILFVVLTSLAARFVLDD